MSHVPRHVEVTYCDDIREEIGNKVSYMGIYSGELFVPSTPIVLPKLCIAVKVVTEMSDPFKGLEVRVLKGEDEAELLSTGQIPGPTDTSQFKEGSTLMVAQMAFMLAPFEIDGETILRVRVNTEREELKGMALAIRLVPPVIAKQDAVQHVSENAPT